MTKLTLLSRTAVLLSLCGAVALAPPASAQDFTSLGPGPVTSFDGSAGRVAAVACSRTDPNLYYIGTCDGGVWKTTTAGASWTPVTDHLPGTPIGDVTLDPQNENIVYAGSGEANFANHSRYGLGLYKSTDAGATWTVLGADVFSGRCISRVLVHPTNSNIVYVALTAAGGGPASLAAKAHPLRNGPRGVFKSTDAGLTWTLLAGGLPALDCTDLEFDPSNPAVLLAGIGHVYGSPDNGVYRSADNGATWTRLSGGLPTTEVGRISFDIARSNPNRIYLMIARPSAGIGVGGSSSGGGELRVAMRSSDAGATWTNVPVGTGLLSTQGFYDILVTVSPTNPDLAYFGGVTIRRTTNGGASTSTVVDGHPDFHAAAWDAAGRCVIGNDGGVYRYNNPATSSAIVPLNNGLVNMQIYAGISTTPANDINIFAGLQDNGTARRRAQGDFQWASVVGGDGGWTQVNPSNPQIVFAQLQGANSLYRSTNGGNSFGSLGGTGLEGRHCFLPVYLIDHTNTNRMIIALERVWESMDGGTTYDPISPDLTLGGVAAIRAMAMSKTDPRYVYCATSDGLVYASTDGGHNFTQRLAGNQGWPRVTRELTAHPTDPQTVYLAGATYGAEHVRRSFDAGATWQVLDGNLPDLPTNVIDVDIRYPVPRLFAGTDRGVYMSKDDGVTWTRYGTGSPNAAVIDLVVEPSRSRMIVATQGRSAWSVPIACPADFNEDGQSDFFDYLDFAQAFADETAAADFNQDGQVDFFDYLDFVGAFDAGC
jgi:hypothetical protein